MAKIIASSRGVLGQELLQGVGVEFQEARAAVALAAAAEIVVGCGRVIGRPLDEQYPIQHVSTGFFDPFADSTTRPAISAGS